MSVDPADLQFSERQDEIRRALVVHCRLTEQQVQSVSQAMNAMQVSFADAALHMGVITQHELDQTVEFVNLTLEQRDLGLIETAIQRRKAGRELITRHRDLVKPSEELILVYDPDNPRCERIRALRTELILLDDTPSQSNALALVSPCAGEGRSLLAAELAISLSQLRRRVLLIDADLRRPRQHLLFNADNSWGLAQAIALRGAPRFFGVEGLPQLSVLTSGPIAPNPLELLSDGRFERLVADWRYNFDDIVFDTPPLSQFSDALSVATLAGRTLVLSRAAMTPRRDMKDMMRRLVSTQARVMGAVLSNF
jgi:protein-tyrosine kinase